MKTLLIALALLLPAAAGAASLEDQYLASRDGYFAKFKTDGEISDAVRKQETLAEADLVKSLRKIIGPEAAKGLPGKGTLNLDGLYQGDEGTDMLDGLRYGSADEKLSIVVSNDVLLKAWLAAHAKEDSFPESVEEALKAETFYTHAISADLAVSRYAEIPVVKPAEGEFAYAMLGLRSQDNSPSTPDEIFIAAVAGNRVYVARAPAGAKIAAMPACDALYKDYMARSNAAYEKYTASGLKDQAQFDQSTKLRDDGDVAFRKCFAEKAPGLGSYAALVQRVQALVDRLPLKYARWGRFRSLLRHSSQPTARHSHRLGPQAAPAFALAWLRHLEPWLQHGLPPRTRNTASGRPAIAPPNPSVMLTGKHLASALRRIRQKALPFGRILRQLGVGNARLADQGTIPAQAEHHRQFRSVGGLQGSEASPEMAEKLLQRVGGTRLAAGRRQGAQDKPKNHRGSKKVPKGALHGCPRSIPRGSEPSRHHHNSRFPMVK